MAAAAATVSGLTASEIAAGSAVVGLAGTAVTAAAAMKQGADTGAIASYQAQVAANDKLIAKQNAEHATAEGDVKAENAGLKAAAALGSIKAGEGAAGIDVNTGSAVDVQTSEKELAETDAQTIRYNAAMKAYGFDVEAESAGAQSQLDQAEAGLAPISGDIGAAGSLLGGAASVGSKYASWTKAGG